MTLMTGDLTRGSKAQKLKELRRQRTSLLGKIKRRNGAITIAQGDVREMSQELRAVEKQIAEMER